MLQAVIDRAMAGRQGAVVVLETGSGQVLAGYDLERAKSRRVRPGSTVKPFTLLALMERKSARARLSCRRRVAIAGRQMDCAHSQDGAPLGAAGALAFSCNSWFDAMAQRLTPEELAGTLRRMGLDTVRVAAGAEQLRLQALGEAAVEVTPLGLAMAYRKLAPLVKGELLEGLLGCVEYGTGRRAAAKGLEVAGKTGTAMARSRAWAHGWFAGFAPAREAKVVAVVFLENGSGGKDAAPIAGAIFQTWAGSL
ncbi:MAG: hypothetical protein GY953_30390 [bacterium]|nr:hypothetical protein [bacterium]